MESRKHRFFYKWLLAAAGRPQPPSCDPDGGSNSPFSLFPERFHLLLPPAWELSPPATCRLIQQHPNPLFVQSTNQPTQTSVRSVPRVMCDVILLVMKVI